MILFQVKLLMLMTHLFMPNANAANSKSLLKKMKKQISSLTASLGQSTELLEEIQINTTNVLHSQSSEINLLKNDIAGIMNSTDETKDILEGMENDTTNALHSQSSEINLLKNDIAGIMNSTDETKELIEGIENNTKNALHRQTSEIIMLKNDMARIRSRTDKLILATGFTEYDGHIILLPSALGGTTYTWQESVTRCLNLGAVPFIPRTIEDFRYMQQIHRDLGGAAGMWYPANDIATEGTVTWYDGTDASSTLRLFDWAHEKGGVYPGDNNEGQDCVNTWSSFSYKLEFDPCTGKMWSMICEML